MAPNNMFLYKPIEGTNKNEKMNKQQSKVMKEGKVISGNTIITALKEKK